MNNYPYESCFDCGKEAGHIPKGHMSSVWQGKCEICEQEKPVTELRDFCYPSIKKLNIIRKRLKLPLFNNEN